MNTQFECIKYRPQATFEIKQHERHEDLKTEIGRFLVDYGNKRSEISELVFKHMDFKTKIAFSQVNGNCNAISKKKWFLFDSKEFVLKFIRQGTSFSEYLSDGGWKEGILHAATLVSFGLTIGASIKSYNHSAKIPPDAPVKTELVKDPDTGIKHNVKYIDHPEAYKAELWKGAAILTGSFAVGLICAEMDYYEYINSVDIDLFFSLSEKDILNSETNSILRWPFPGFYNWKRNYLKAQLRANPPNWRQDATLAAMICPISKGFIFYPVKDSCKHEHYFDYRSVRAYQLNPKNKNPTSCPLSLKQPNHGLLTVTFDKGMFDYILGRLWQGPGQPLDRIERKYWNLG